MRLRSALRDDLPEIVQLLMDCGLPTDDVPEALGAFVTASVGKALAGVVALERFGDVGLLRSLAVAPTYRGRGIGRRLCEHVLEEAERRGLRQVYLLTTDATDYFARHGFVAVGRDRAPERIRRTRQFRELCPGTATLMRRPVAADG